MEQMRVLLVARRSGRDQRIQTLNQIHHLVFCAPQPIRERFLGRPQRGMLTEMTKMRPRNGPDPGHVRRGGVWVMPCRPRRFLSSRLLVRVLGSPPRAGRLLRVRWVGSGLR
jgi:hypothetical protein